jgi:signal transduction histidine kinase/CheY-like chemotaxis protein
MKRQSGGAVSLRTWLFFLAVVGGLGALTVAAIAGWTTWREQKAQVGLSFLATSRAMTGALDREIDQAVALARALSVSGNLSRGDLGAFDLEARRVLTPYGYALILTPEDSSRQLVNTLMFPGMQVRDELGDDWIEPSARAGAVAVKPLLRSSVTGQWVAVVQVPITTFSGATRYLINIVIPASSFQRIIAEQRLPKDWNPVIVDSNWTVVARGVSPETFVGGKAASPWVQNSPEPNIVYETHYLEGDYALSALSRSAQYGWSVAVGMPEAKMFRQYLGPVLLSALVAFAVAAAAFGAVAFVTIALMRGVRSLAIGTEALARGEPVRLPRLRVRELAVVGEGMQRAAAKLGDQARLLEARIAEVTSDLRREGDERRRAEAALAHAQRLESLGQLTGGVAHDFNNLLTVISGNLEFIETRAGSVEVKRFVHAAQQGVARGARLVESLLAFARKQPLHSQTVNPNWLIKQFASVLKGAAGDAVQLQLLLSPTLHPCRVDAVRFQSALLNLVTNATAAMPDGGRIAIETENVEIDAAGEGAGELEPGTYVRITVSDTGTGMPSQVAARAFEPFFTTKEVGKGSGLGLAQVYGFAKQSGGHAELLSEMGVGTTVRLYLPRSMDAEMEQAGPIAQPVPLKQDGEVTVLVVDDDSAVRSVLTDLIEEMGYRAMEAQDGPAALAMIERGEQIDLVLTDYSMPRGMTGVELGRRIAALRPEIKLVLISGYPEPRVRSADLEFPLLTKPFRRAELGRVIREAFERPDVSRFR